MIALKPIRRKHLPSRVTVRFVAPEPGSEAFHAKRITEGAAFFYALGARKETSNAR